MVNWFVACYCMLLTPPQGRLMEIRNVWAENLEIELANMRKLVDKYCYVAMVRCFCSVCSCKRHL